MLRLPTDPRGPELATSASPPMPEWVQGFRDHQVPAIEQVVDHLTNGVKYVLLDAPTGAGKTLIAEAIRRMVKAPRTRYVCTTKSLQDQFARDFPYAAVLKGKVNYPTLDHPEQFGGLFGGLSCADCTRSMVAASNLPVCDACPRELDEETLRNMPARVPHCRNCHPFNACPYRSAFQAALRAELMVTNTAFLMTGALPVANLVIADECDMLESQLMGKVEIAISDRRRRDLKLGYPKKKTVEDAWWDWLKAEAIPKVEQYGSKLSAHILGQQDPDPKEVRELEGIQDLKGRLVFMDEQMEKRSRGDGEDAIEFVYESAQADKGLGITFKPIRVSQAAPGTLWRMAGQWILMSATIVDPHEFTESLGIGDERWEMVSVPNTFPKANRPIYAVGGPDMSHRATQDSNGANIDLQAELVAKVLRKHPEDRVLVHTVSYRLAQDLFDRLRGEFRDRLIIYGDARGREDALERYKKLDAAVALAPSFDRGVDLPEDLCRVQVIAKVPFPNLGDKQVNRRLYSRGGQLWYAVATVRTIVQMTGRGVRSKDDRCVTYITDRQFVSNVWGKSRMLFPSWWKEALDFSGGAL